MNQQLKEALRKYHQARGFVLYDSFPLVTNDPTVLFTNATITPFKHFFGNDDVVPHDYALVQQCLRVGGGAGGLETAQRDSNYSSLFEMFGCGLFNRTYPAAVDYFLEMLGHIGLSKGKFRFVVPEESAFVDALLQNGIDRSSMFTINENGDFWQDWRFGEDGLVGKGLTAVFSREDTCIMSISELLGEPTSFVEIGNLIHVYGQVDGGKIIPVAHEGFDVGIGMGRLSIALEGKTLYELSPFRESAELVATYLKALGIVAPAPGTVRVMVDHLRSICALVHAGVTPGNKQQAFILRKLIRSLLEILWLCAGKMVSSAEIISVFAESVSPGTSSLAMDIVGGEERVFRDTLERGRLLLVKNPRLSPETLRSTYGIRPMLLSLIRGE